MPRAAEDSSRRRAAEQNGSSAAVDENSKKPGITVFQFTRPPTSPTKKTTRQKTQIFALPDSQQAICLYSQRQNVCTTSHASSDTPPAAFCQCNWAPHAQCAAKRSTCLTNWQRQPRASSAAAPKARDNWFASCSIADVMTDMDSMEYAGIRGIAENI